MSNRRAVILWVYPVAMLAAGATGSAREAPSIRPHPYDNESDRPVAVTSAAATESVWPTLIPWVELNAPETPTASRPGVARRDHVLEGLQAWRPVADIAIITTRNSRIDDVYRDLKARKPDGMFIIGGFKTMDFFRDGHFDDPAGWERVAVALRRVADLTGCDTVVLENETALGPVNSGKVTLDFDRLTAALSPIRRTGIVVWWNMPSIQLNTPQWPQRRDVTARLVKTIASALPNSRFLVGYRAFATDPRHPQFDDLARQMAGLVGRERMIDKYHVRAEGGSYSLQREFYAPDMAWRVLVQPGAGVGVIYTGESNWVSVGRAMARLRQ